MVPVTQKPPRGIRNNNPCNIRKSTAVWVGQAAEQPDSAFVTFTAPEYGLRAAMRILRTYSRSYGLNTVQGLISKWAPPNENETPAYVAHVSKCMGIVSIATLNMNDPDILVAIVQAMTSQENGPPPSGGDWYLPEIYEAAKRLYLAG